MDCLLPGRKPHKNQDTHQSGWEWRFTAVGNRSLHTFIWQLAHSISESVHCDAASEVCGRWCSALTEVAVGYYDAGIWRRVLAEHEMSLPDRLVASIEEGCKAVSAFGRPPATPCRAKIHFISIIYGPDSDVCKTMSPGLIRSATSKPNQANKAAGPMEPCKATGLWRSEDRTTPT